MSILIQSEDMISFWQNFNCAGVFFAISLVCNCPLQLLRGNAVLIKTFSGFSQKLALRVWIGQTWCLPNEIKRVGRGYAQSTLLFSLRIALLEIVWSTIRLQLARDNGPYSRFVNNIDAYLRTGKHILILRAYWVRPLARASPWNSKLVRQAWCQGCATGTRHVLIDRKDVLVSVHVWSRNLSWWLVVASRFEHATVGHWVAFIKYKGVCCCWGMTDVNLRRCLA